MRFTNVVLAAALFSSAEAALDERFPTGIRTDVQRRDRAKGGKGGKVFPVDGVCPGKGGGRGTMSRSTSKGKKKGKGKIDEDAVTGRFVDAEVTPDTIFGNGNSNGFFTCQRTESIEVCIRAKQRGPIPQNPDGTYSNDDGSFTVPSGGYAADLPSPTINRAVWSYDWSVNVDWQETTGDVLGDYVLMLSIDADPSCDTCYANFFPLTTTPTVPALPGFFGDNNTPNDGGNTVLSVVQAILQGGGTPDPGAIFQELLDTSNIVQQSSNPSFNTGFFGTGLEFFDFDQEGVYNLALRVGQFKEEGATPTCCDDNFEEIVSVETSVFVDADQAPQVA
jgi:hypothetical protein